jgi:MATE family multidrug resistance protein
MRKNIILSYIEGIFDTQNGESYERIMSYFIPEFITNLIVYSMPLWVDAILISYLQSTPTFATLGVTNNVIHLVLKIAEALSVSTVVLSGQYNGRKDYIQVGRTMRDAFWLTCIVGLFFFLVLFYGSYWIYRWYGVSEEIITLGVPFLRLRALGVLFMFIYFAFVGFLRGIKNTRSVMKIFIFGAAIFVVVDYVLIFGKWGFPAMGLQGSALATAIQYGSMLLVALCYVIFNQKNRKYGIQLFSVFESKHDMHRLIKLTLPVVVDKATLAMAYIWLGKMIAPMGTIAVAAFCAIKDIERFAFLPAIGFAHVITFLASNDAGANKWDDIKINIKKIILLAFCMVCFILIVFYIWSDKLIYLFDKKGDFTPLVLIAFPFTSILVIFDLLQLILSGALRGTGNMHTVMVVRLVVCLFYFVPCSYLLSVLPIENQALKFILIYGSFYIGNALMSILYVKRFRSDHWKTSQF